MPYAPINKDLSLNEDIRLQHKYSVLATELSRQTNFTRNEVMNLINIYHMWTKAKGRVMDKLCFTEFMNTCLDFRNIDAVEKIHMLGCHSNKRFMTEREFVFMLSLLLKGSVAETIKFCFNVYTEMIGSPEYITKDDVLMMARKGSTKIAKLASVESEAFDQNFVEFVMSQVDKDRDNRISLDDYRLTVNEDITWLEFLEEVLPSPESIELFMVRITTRPYVNKMELAWGDQQEEITSRIDRTRFSESRMTTESLNLSESHESSQIDQIDDLNVITESHDDSRKLHLF